MVNQNYDANFYDISHAAADFREADEFKEFAAKVLTAVGKAKNGATYRQLNKRFPNRANWLNEAVESLEMSGKIERTGSVSITRFIIGGAEIKMSPKVTKKKGFAAGIYTKSALPYPNK